MMFDKMTSGSEAVAKTNSLLRETKKAFVDAYVDVEKLGSAFEGFKNGTVSKTEVLKQYNETLGQVYGKTKNVNEAEEIGRAHV